MLKLARLKKNHMQIVNIRDYQARDNCPECLSRWPWAIGQSLLSSPVLLFCRGVSLAEENGSSLVAALYRRWKMNKCDSVWVKVKVAFLRARSPRESDDGACFHALIPSNGPHQLLRRDSCASCRLGPHQPPSSSCGNVQLGNSSPPVSLHGRPCQTRSRLNIACVLEAEGKGTWGRMRRSEVPDLVGGGYK